MWLCDMMLQAYKCRLNMQGKKTCILNAVALCKMYRLYYIVKDKVITSLSTYKYLLRFFSLPYLLRLSRNAQYAGLL